ncbi:hypothetical protein AbraIFM66951_011688 [Aspergillus brasiliensis]|uniref:Major facilitator superfamily (MFS) profile domain-containing protein n=1 Tax=Aspergillus brasiliensis TaxID=319629 RepID=A0A9W5YTI7_9EURO|nr:hypothetical protein AbraCBS73388_009658 [Aspergillus brasiliensis]GKZ41941.1 hypothetical protein AbraIFM66951_011688 [Aspergillus brasiliensis]
MGSLGDGALFGRAWTPLILLFTFPAVAFTGLIYGFLLAWVSVLGAVQSLYLLYPPYNFNSAQIGLFNLSGLVGGIIDSIIGGPLTDWLAITISRRNHGIYEPEYRLYLGTPTACLCAAGLLLFGFELEQGASWVVLAISTAIYCIGLGLGSDIALTYLTDCYQDIIGDAFVAVAFVRNAISIIIMFVFTPWIDGMGIKSTFILCGVLAFVSLNICIPMIMFGKKARIHTAERYKYYAGLQPLSRDRH